MRSAIVLSLLVAFAPEARAQQPLPDARWQPFLGCWTPSVPGASGADATLCILPSADGRGVRMLSFSGDREILAETLVADGSRQPLQEQECTGDRVSRWDRTGTRVFSNATVTCEGQPPVSTSGLSALVRSDVMLDLQVSARDGREQARARRLARSNAVPAPVADLVRSLQVVRVVPGVIGADDVIEARAAVSATTVEAWLAESGARASVDRSGLLRLADAKVEGRVIDLLVAMAYPQKFQVRRSSGGGGGAGFGGSTIDAGFYPGAWDGLADVYGYGLYSYGFGAFGLPYYLGGSYYFPGSIYYVPGGAGAPAQDDSAHGQVVNGQGYTRVQPREPYRGTATRSDGGSATTSGTTYEGSRGSGGSSDSGGGASPAGYSGGGAGGGGGTGLTAVPR